jgi:hypothetical protein
MAALTDLELKIDRHIKDNADQIKSFKTELQSLKSVAKPKVSRIDELAKPKEVQKKSEIPRKPPTNLVKNAVTASMPSINMKNPKKSVCVCVCLCLICDLLQFADKKSNFHVVHFVYNVDIFHS